MLGPRLAAAAPVSGMVSNGSGNDNPETCRSCPTIRQGLDGTVLIEGAGQNIHNIDLQPGWNMISSFVLPDETDIELLLAGIDDDMVLIKNGAGQVYWPEFLNNDIGTWNEQEGYQIYMQNSATLAVPGTIIDPQVSVIDLTPGWSLVAYLRTSPLAVDQALNSLDDQLVLAKNQLGQVYWPDFNIDQIGSMQPGQGYQLILNSQGRLAYPQN